MRTLNRKPGETASDGATEVESGHPHLVIRSSVCIGSVTLQMPTQDAAAKLRQQVAAKSMSVVQRHLVVVGGDIFRRQARRSAARPRRSQTILESPGANTCRYSVQRAYLSQ